MLINTLSDKSSNVSTGFLSNDDQFVPWYFHEMANDNEEFIFNSAYCDRVKRFREQTHMTAAQMAELLNVPAERYRKYETRSPMPPYLMERFCRIVGCDLEHLIIAKPRTRMKPVIVARGTGTDG
jgi:DNA-binding transcriptional regulator YiaG